MSITCISTHLASRITSVCYNLSILGKTCCTRSLRIHARSQRWLCMCTNRLRLRSSSSILLRDQDSAGVAEPCGADRTVVLSTQRNRRSANIVSNKNISDWVCLYWKLLPDLPGMFLSYLRARSGHIVKKLYRPPGGRYVISFPREAFHPAFQAQLRRRRAHAPPLPPRPQH